jgi:hypothetical protein
LYTSVEENQPLFTDEPVEFEKQLVEVHDFRKITHHFGGMMCGIHLNINKEKPKDHNM